MDIDLSDILNNIRIPYFIVQGETDIVTPTRVIADFIKTCDNDNLKFKVIHNSGHMPGGESLDYIISKGFKFLYSGNGE
jgi:pimeloyl-ACP methyl ester carboxylesterase